MKCLRRLTGEALERWNEGPDVLILDVMLPDTDGYELLRLFREKDRDIPVLMLTAKSQMNDKLLGSLVQIM